MLGSSLEIKSSRQIVEVANKHEKPVAIINIGETKADKSVDIKIEIKIDANISGIMERI